MQRNSYLNDCPVENNEEAEAQTEDQDTCAECETKAHGSNGSGNGNGSLPRTLTGSIRASSTAAVLRWWNTSMKCEKRGTTLRSS